MIFGLLANSIVTPQYLKTDQFLNNDTFIKKVWYITLCATFFRYRLFVAFTFATWTCKALGLGAYPKNLLCKPFTGPSISNYLNNFDLNTKNKLNFMNAWNDVKSLNDITYFLI